MISSHRLSLWLAAQFLTRLPIHLHRPPTPEETGRSLLYYPVVGLLIGLMLLGLAHGLTTFHPSVAATLILTFWVLITGALHLDGLADSADAWLGGQGNRERSLAIMKDPNCGPAGVLALILVLLIKYTAISQLLSNGNHLALLLAPIWSRALLLLLFLTTPYVRVGGLGSVLADYLPRRSAWLVFGVTTAILLIVTGRHSYQAIAASLLMFVFLRRLMCQRLGGTTGDTAGALVVLAEATQLIGIT